MRRFLAGAAFCLALAACETRPVLNIQDAPLVATPGRDTGEVIERVLEARGWQVTARRPGEIDAALLVRTHRADITVSYDATSYDITYRDSENLAYDGEKIHMNYNKWITFLSTDIGNALGVPAAGE